MKLKFAPGTTKLAFFNVALPPLTPDTITLQLASARRYALARAMRDEWLKTGDPYWLQCYEIDMLAAGSMSASARRRMDVDSL